MTYLIFSAEITNLLLFEKFQPRWMGYPKNIQYPEISSELDHSKKYTAKSHFWQFSFHHEFLTVFVTDLHFHLLPVEVTEIAPLRKFLILYLQYTGSHEQHYPEISSQVCYFMKYYRRFSLTSLCSQNLCEFPSSYFWYVLVSHHFASEWFSLVFRVISSNLSIHLSI